LPDLAVAFARAPYRVAGLTLRIGRRDRALDRLLAGLGVREAMLITAANPHGRRVPAAWNARRQAALWAALGAQAIMPAESGAGRWREPQILAAGPAGRLIRTGRRFRQAALVRLRPGQAPALVPLR